MNAQALLPGILARRLLMPGEDLLWATRTGKQGFDVPGLKVDGTPKDGVMVKVAAGAATVVGEALLGGGDDTGRPQPPDLVFSGRSTAEIAVGHGFAFTGPSYWVLTTQRLIRADHVPEPAPEPKRKGFLRGVVDVGKIVVDVVTSPTTNAGVETVDKPLVVVAEFPRAAIRAITPTKHRNSGVRVEMADGSAIDFLVGHGERMLALSHGAPE